MTNKKTPLGIKLTFGTLCLGALGMMSSTIYSIRQKNQVYPTINKEASIVYELKGLENNKLFVENPTSLESYFPFKQEYTHTLESKLQEVRTSPEYIAEQQKKEENKKSSDTADTVSYLFMLLVAGAFIYPLKYIGKKETSQPTSSEGEQK